MGTALTHPSKLSLLASSDSQFDTQCPLLAFVLIDISEQAKNGQRASIRPALESSIGENVRSGLVDSLCHLLARLAYTTDLAALPVLKVLSHSLP